MAFEPFIGSDLCKCIEAELQSALGQMVNTVNRLVREKTRLNNLLKRAPLQNLIESALDEALQNVIDFETELRTITEGNVFGIPTGSTFGGIVRCIKGQINQNINNALVGLDLRGLVPRYCDLINNDELQSLVDFFLPQIEAFGQFCSPTEAALFNANVVTNLGIIGAGTDGTFRVEDFTQDAAGQLTAAYKTKFDEIVNCCLRVRNIQETVENFVVDANGNPFNNLTFAPIAPPGFDLEGNPISQAALDSLSSLKLV